MRSRCGLLSIGLLVLSVLLIIVVGFLVRKVLYTPAYNPNEQWIAFDCYVPGYDSNYRIYLVKSDGKGLHPLLPSDEAFNYAPSWSPDGKRIAFSDRRVMSERSCKSTDFRENTSLYTIAPDGSNMQLLLEIPEALHLTMGDWSPDGEWIVFTVYWGGSDSRGIYDLYKVQSDGSELQQLTDGLWVRTPSWSPDGEWIVFTAWDNGVRNWEANLFKVRADGTDLTQLTFENNAAFPDWSPDGEWIVYEQIVRAGTSTELFETGLYKMTPDGSEQVQVPVTSQSFRELSFPSWSPDGNSIVFAGFHNDGIDLYAITAKGEDMRRLTKKNLHCIPGESTWSPTPVSLEEE